MAKKKPRRVVIFLLFRCMAFLMYVLPLRLAVRIGAQLGRWTFYILRREQALALGNLERAFGNSSSFGERRIITKGVFENLGKNLAEVVSLSKFNQGNIDSYITCRGLEVMDRVIRKGKGGIMLSAHFGNWELLAHYFAIKGYLVNVIARRIRMEQFESFLSVLRKCHGVSVLYRDISVKEVIAVLKKNEFLGIMPDQDMDSVSGVFVDFFGRPAYTPTGPAVLNLLAGAPIVPCFIIRRDSGHEIVIEEPMELSATGDRSKDILENTRRYTKVIEGYIRKFPSQWVWFHDRWKTRDLKND